MPGSVSPSQSSEDGETLSQGGERKPFVRQKAWAPRVKTGCVTCRSRRIKCDETKPLCRRCISTGRKCGGYTNSKPQQEEEEEQQPSPKPQKSWHWIQLCQPLVHSSAPTSVQETPRERQIFQLLRTATVAQVNGGVNSDFWTVNLLQAAKHYPAIWHASLGLSAMHQRMKIRSDTEVDRRISQDLYVFALLQYNISIGHVLKLTSRGVIGYQDQETVLMASVLYVGICSVQNNTAQAKCHAQNAIRLFSQWKFRDYADRPLKTRPKGVLDAACLNRVMNDVYFSTAAMVPPFAEDVPKSFIRAVTRTTAPFASATEAYYEYLPIHHNLAVIPDWEGAHDTDKSRQDPTVNQSLIRRHAFSRWYLRFQAYKVACASEPQSMSIADSRLTQLLDLLYLLQDTFQTIMIDRTPQTWKKHHHKWDKIVSKAEELLKSQDDAASGDIPASPMFSYSMSLMEVLFMVGNVCRDSTIRQRVVDALIKWPQIDGIYNSNYARLIVQAKNMFEQKWMTLREPHSCECVENLFLCQDHRLAQFEESFPADGMVTFLVKNGIQSKLDLPWETVTYTI